MTRVLLGRDGGYVEVTNRGGAVVLEVGCVNEGMAAEWLPPREARQVATLLIESADALEPASVLDGEGDG